MTNTDLVQLTEQCARLTAAAQRCGLQIEDLDEAVHEAAAGNAARYNNERHPGDDDATHDMFSQQASNINNGSLDDQVQFLIDQLGVAGAQVMVSDAALDKLDDALAQMIGTATAVRTWLHARDFEAAPAWTPVVAGLAEALARCYRTLAALGTVEADLHARAGRGRRRFLSALLKAFRFDTDRVGELYCDRAYLAAVIAALLDALARLGLARPPLLCANDPNWPDHAVLHLWLPNLFGESDQLDAVGRSFTLHIHPRDQWLFEKWRVDAAVAPRWDQASKTTERHRISLWVAALRTHRATRHRHASR
ncbi:hypothetical protein [Nocardia suismassiliense]|uniref:hypothetical protein n=1 Tax=Nocardia suismassiliense TaxID=2077092 RepID=UPI000D1EFC56|nr:hypothetical protein [Nocardia suismassiliense]